MHVYIYDSFVNQKKFDGLLARIETRITDLGLNGKISRLSLMKNIRDTVADEIRRGAKTVVAVGNDQTVNQVAAALSGTDIPVGIIPIGAENNLIAACLGVGLDLAACDVLSARRIERLDLGQAGSSYFLSRASIPTQGTIVEINQNYSIETLEPGEINIVNLAPPDLKLPGGKFDPQDGKLELYIETRGKKNFLKKTLNQSIFTFKRLSVINGKLPLILDNAVAVNSPVEITVAPRALNVIVGKGRRF